MSQTIELQLCDLHPVCKRVSTIEGKVMLAKMFQHFFNIFWPESIQIMSYFVKRVYSELLRDEVDKEQR